MTPLSPGRLGHFAVRTHDAVVGNTVRWPSDFRPRGLPPMRDRMDRPHALAMPPARVVVERVRSAPSPFTTIQPPPPC